MKKILLTTTLLAITALPTFAQADNGKELSVQQKTVAEHQAYQYEFDREQCQGYDFGIKKLGITDTCKKKPEQVIVEVEVIKEVIVEAPAPAAVEPVKVLKEYIVYFDFDKSTIRNSDISILNSVSSEIQQYNPDDVLIAGYTDTRGSQAYNSALSAKRANVVSNYLNKMGVGNSVVNQKALGETNLAVPTGDSTKSQENRRVTIQFVR